MLALLILNLEQSGKYTPFRSESQRSAAELILCGHSSGTWSFHSFFCFFLQQVMQKYEMCLCVWVRWLGFEKMINGDWVCVCMCVCVLKRCPYAWPDISYSISPLSTLSLCIREGFISPAPTHSCVLTVKGERHQYSTPAALSALNTLQAVRANTRRMWTSPS